MIEDNLKKFLAVSDITDVCFVDSDQTIPGFILHQCLSHQPQHKIYNWELQMLRDF